MATVGTTNISALKRILVSGYIWAFAGRMLTAIAGLVINSMLARLLNPDELGAYFLVVSMVTMLTMVGMLGLQRGVVSVVSDAVARGLGGRACRGIKLSFYLVFAASLIIALLMPVPGSVLIGNILESKLIPAVMWLAAILLVVRALSSLFAETFRAFHDIRSAVLFNGLFVNLCFAGILVVVYTAVGVSSLREVMILSIVVYALNTFIEWLFSRMWCQDLGHEGWIGVRELLRIALPLMGTTLVMFVITQADLWIVGASLNEKDVALYGASVKLVQLVTIPLMITNAVLPSIITDLYARGDRPLLEKVLRTSALVAGVPAVIMLFAIMFKAGDILTVLYGAYYRDGASVLVLIGLGQLVNVLAGTGLLVLMLVGKQVHSFLISLVSGLCLIAGCLYAASQYGIQGVALVVSLVLALQAIVVLLVVRLTVGVWSHAGFGGFDAILRLLKGTAIASRESV
jgi:O-antigen/teichoic acid export membrane protein